MADKRTAGEAHLDDDDLADGQLERNDTYKEDAYDRMCGVPHFSDAGTVKSALTSHERTMARRKRMTVSKYRQRYYGGLSPTDRVPIYLIGYTNPDSGLRNFGHRSTKLEVLAVRRGAVTTLRGASGGQRIKRARIEKVKEEAEAAYRLRNPKPLFESKLPYPHNAHHIIPVATFHVDSWFDAVPDTIGTYRGLVAASEYDINLPENIIYLPHPFGSTWICKVHNLPNHAKAHNIYNEKVTDHCAEVYDLIERASDEEDCETRDDFLRQVYDKLIQIQTTLDGLLQSAGAVSIGDAI